MEIQDEGAQIKENKKNAHNTGLLYLQRITFISQKRYSYYYPLLGGSLLLPAPFLGQYLLSASLRTGKIDPQVLPAVNDARIWNQQRG